VGREGSEHIQNSKADVTQHRQQHAKQGTNMDHVKEFVFETSTITINEIVEILGISSGSIEIAVQ
jgi:hypothetical protein